MEKLKIFDRVNLVGLLVGLSLAAGLIITAAQVTRVWLHIADSQIISVTGAAREEVVSDLAHWSASFEVEAEKMTEAQKSLKNDANKLEQFLTSRSITNAEISTITIERLKSRSDRDFGDATRDRTVGFRLRQTVRFSSTNLQQVTDLQQQSGVLVEEGVQLDDHGITFIYSKSAEAKTELLAAATKNARQRAEQIATQGGRKIGELRSARMGVFQITPRNSNEISAEGINDTSSREKTIRAVVSASFTME